MKKLITLSLLLLFWIFPNIGKAQLIGFDTSATNLGSLPDTINLNDSFSHTLVIQNFDSVNDFTGTIFLQAALDSGGTLIREITVGSVFVSNFGWLDTISITYAETYDTLNRYKLGDNIVVVWPVAGTSLIRDTIRQHVYIDSPAAIHGLNNANKDILIYPNPFINILHIKGIYLGNALKQVRLFDVYGRMVYSGDSSLRINIEGVKSGIYFLELGFVDGIKQSYQLVKE
jgi:hypothetical protein